MSATRYVLMLALATLFGILLVAQQTAIFHLGYSVRRLETEVALRSEQNRRLLCDISVLSEPARIADQVERLNIALVDPVKLTMESMSAKQASPPTRVQPSRAARAAH